jgi:Ner family transcriptional regulator
MDDTDTTEQEVSDNPDWHPADVQAALKKRGFSLAGVSAAEGYHATAAGKALRRPWPALEVIIAAAIGVSPCQIWPSRYKSRPSVSKPEIGMIEKS